MNLRTRSGRLILVSIIGLTSFVGIQHLSPISASADTCVLDPQSSALQPGWGTTCNVGGGGSGNGTGGPTIGSGQSNGNSPQSPSTGKIWLLQDAPLGPCQINGVDGQYYEYYSVWANDPTGQVVDHASPATMRCIVSNQATPTPTASGPVLPPIAQIQQQVRQFVVAGTINTDYGSRFLTGAFTNFTATAAPIPAKDLDVPGFHVWFEAKPTFEWNFGDPFASNSGESSPNNPNTNSDSGPSVEHQYGQTPNETTTITVSLTTVWNGMLHIDATGGSSGQQIPLEPISLDSNLTRPIVQVKSVQTEPSHA